uniref:Macro domain-containing protein n=1 Tax=Aplanochytrium stocchinoi TaxID=215587 RepID=A0A7S3PFK3_9STRA|mmetsp:Transcript_10240/g.12784  ORF Transcript_10240/g.12784 Transcript_10240/m.12784 type:complete len:229 (-) Transcript_10240:285-971(-)|eukprot:CAMPEP_0204829756 /NCGR_PEP_ID=MMETSP1346-20131115/8085_1 /ASSEMBLY_ACC=CAM_ASM_000771 /TAXON_ID=215587 /ORGANISM="Aplanochytrium stocchinoi, Strain GSBS06" /LENGTH=228 /DNA_ID=CAMNT_0051959811 /DNA_START=76 /DNA_END=762 /DNA_ORIENTATION=-
MTDRPRTRSIVSQGSLEEVEMEIALNKLHRNVIPLAIHLIRNNVKFIVSAGSVVHFKGDAIVNAANTGCLGGGGVDGAINEAGGPELEEARQALPVIGGMKRCLTGDAVVTVGGKLKSKWCIHAVGPNYYLCSSQEEGDKLLASAYKNALLRAEEKGVKSLAFSLLSSGIFRGSRSLSDILRIGVKSIADNTYEGLEEVNMVAFTDAEQRVLIKAADEILGENENNNE